MGCFSWSPICSDFSINHRELLAVLFAVRGFLPLLQGRYVAFYADNTTALAYLKTQGDTLTLNAVDQVILRFSKSHRIHLLLQFIPGNLNVLADSLSHKLQVLGSEWTLPSGVSATLTPLASHHRSLCDCTQSLSPGLLFAHGGSAVSGHGCDAPVL